MKPQTLSPAERRALIEQAELRYGLAPGSGYAGGGYSGGGQRSYPQDLAPRQRSSGGFGGPGDTAAVQDMDAAVEQCWTLYRCLVLLADAHSSLTGKLYRGSGDTEQEVATGAAADLLSFVNPHWDPAMLWGMTSMAMDVSPQGCFWILDAIDGQGRPGEIWWTPPGSVRPVRGDAKKDKPEDWYISHYEVKVPGGSGRPKRFDRERVVWIRTPSPFNEFSALSPVRAALQSAGLALSSLHANKMLFETGMTGAGYVVPTENITWSDEQRADVAQMFASTVKGRAGWHRVLVANRRDFEVKDLKALSPRDLQFAQMMALTESQICQGMGVPEPLLKPTDSTFTNAREARRTFWENSVIPRASRIASAITSQLLDVHFAGEAERFAFDYSTVPELQADAAAKWSLAKDQLASMLDLARQVVSGLVSRDGALQAAAYYVGAPEALALAMIPDPTQADGGGGVVTIDLPPLTDLRLLLSGVAEGAVSRASAIAILEAKTGSRPVAEAIVADAGTGIRSTPLSTLQFARELVVGVTAGQLPRQSAAALLAEALGDGGKAVAVLADAAPQALPAPADDGAGGTAATEEGGGGDAAGTGAAVDPAASRGHGGRRETEVIVYRAGQGYRLRGPAEGAEGRQGGEGDADGAGAVDSAGEAAVEGGSREVEEDDLPASPFRQDDVRAYGSEAHQRAWADEVKVIEGRLGRIRAIAERVLSDHLRDAVAGMEGLTEARLEAIVTTTVADLADLSREDLDALAGELAGEVISRASRPRWIERGAEAMERGLRDLAEDVGAKTLSGLGVDGALDLADDSPMTAALRRRAQRFAESTANTSWLQVGDRLARGVRDGKGLKDLAGSLKDLGEQWQGSRAEMIAWTETHSASQTVATEAARHSGVVKGRRWLTSLDDRVRDSHRDAHGQEVGLDEPFIVGGNACEAPGECGAPEEDIQCRCVQQFVLED